VRSGERRLQLGAEFVAQCVLGDVRIEGDLLANLRASREGGQHGIGAEGHRLAASTARFISFTNPGTTRR
jgi:hypothetical protein